MKWYYPALDRESVHMIQNVVPRTNPPRRLGEMIDLLSPYGSVIDHKYHKGMWAGGTGHLDHYMSRDGLTWKHRYSFPMGEMWRLGYGGTVFRMRDGRYGCLFFAEGAGLMLATLAPRQDDHTWQVGPEPILRASCDTNNVAIWDEEKHTYKVYLRAWEMRNDLPRRKVVVTEIDAMEDLRTIEPTKPPERKDIAPWPLSDELPTAFDTDTDDLEVYTPAVTRWEDWWLAFPTIMRKVEPVSGMPEGVSDIGLACSREGLTWTLFDEPYVRLGPEGEGLDTRTLYMYTNMIKAKDELLHYYCGLTRPHAEGGKASTDGLGLNGYAVHGAAQKPGRFACMEFGRGGIMVTEPIMCDGVRLLLDADISAMGKLAVRLEIFPFHTEVAENKHCYSLYGDSQEHVVRWSTIDGGSSTRGFQGYHVRMTFFGERCKLFRYGFNDG